MPRPLGGWLPLMGPRDGFVHKSPTGPATITALATALSRKRSPSCVSPSMCMGRVHRCHFGGLRAHLSPLTPALLPASPRHSFLMVAVVKLHPAPKQTFLCLLYLSILYRAQLETEEMLNELKKKSLKSHKLHGVAVGAGGRAGKAALQLGPPHTIPGPISPP